MNKKHAFGLLQATNALSGISNGVVMITVPWIVLEITGSAAKAGLLAALSSVPGIVVSPVVGGLVDRFGRRAISIFSDVMSMLSVLMFLIVNVLGDLTYFWILAIAVLGACFDPAGYTARKALIPNVAQASGIDIDVANGRFEGIFAIGFMVGPAIGSACINWSGPMLGFAVTAATFALASIAVLFMRVDDEHGKTVAHHEDGHEPFLSSLRDGFSVLTKDKPLLALSISFMFLSGLYMPIDTVIFPVYFESMKNATGLGILFAALAGGMVVGSFAYGRLAAKFSTSTLLRGVMAVSTLSLLPLVALPPTWIFAVLGFFAGLSWGPFNPLWNSIVQKRVQPNMQGRVYGLQMSLLYAAPPLGQLVVGACVDKFGLQPTFIVVMAMFGLVGFTVATTPIFRKL